MPNYQIYFAPEGRIVGREYGDNPSQARKRFARANPKYKRAMGELDTTEIVQTYYSNGLYRIETLRNGEIYIYGMDGRFQEHWAHGAWLENGRVFDSVKATALRNRALIGTWL